MSTYNVQVTGVDTTAGVGPQAMLVPHVVAKAGDIILSVSGVADIQGIAIFQQQGFNLSGAQILLLMQGS